MHEDGFTKYYEYVFLYTDDCLVIINLGDCVLRDEIGNYFNLKEAYINAPSSFASQSLNEKEIKSAEDYQTVFLTPDFTSCDRYDTSYKLNEYSHHDSSGRMITSPVGIHHALVGAADVSAAQASGGNMT